MNCAACHKPFKQHFQITRFDANGKQLASVDVCSAACLIHWTYNYSMTQGMRLAIGAKSTLQRLLESLKG